MSILYDERIDGRLHHVDRAELLAEIQARLPDIKVGPASDPTSEMGPLITGEHRDKVAGYVAGAAEEGATVVVDGRSGVPRTLFALQGSDIFARWPEGRTAFSLKYNEWSRAK